MRKPIGLEYLGKIEMKQLIIDTIHPQGKTTISVSSNFATFPLPRIIRLEPSNLCNLKCIHCPIGLEINFKRGNMSEEVFDQIVKELKTFGRIDVVVLYHGGEPFLNKKIFKMIRVLKSIGNPFIKINTNGMLFGKKKIVDFIKSGIDDLCISLDGLSPEENNHIRKDSDYHQIVSSIKKLLWKKTELHSNIPNVCISNTQIPTVTQVQQGIGPLVPQFILDDFIDFPKQLEFNSRYAIPWSGFDSFGDLMQARNPILKESPPDYCDNIMQTITIKWNGDVVPCCYDIMGKFVLGNIMKEPISKIWNNRKYRKLRENIYARNYPTLCKVCQIIKPGFYLVKKNIKASKRGNP